MTAESQPTVHRGSRCGLCYWALYDGDWCQNKACVSHGKAPPHVVYLTNEEARILIAEQWENREQNQ